MARADDAAEVDVAALLADAVDGAGVDGGGDAAPENQRVAPAARLPAAVRPNSRYLNTQVYYTPLKTMRERFREFTFQTSD